MIPYPIEVTIAVMNTAEPTGILPAMLLAGCGERNEVASGEFRPSGADRSHTTTLSLF